MLFGIILPSQLGRFWLEFIAIGLWAGYHCPGNGVVIADAAGERERHTEILLLFHQNKVIW